MTNLTENYDVIGPYEHACMEDPNLCDLGNVNATSSRNFSGFLGRTSTHIDPNELILSDRQANLNSTELVKSNSVDLFVSSPFDLVDFGDAYKFWLAMMLRNFGNAIRFVCVLKLSQVCEVLWPFMIILNFVWVFKFSQLFRRNFSRPLFTFCLLMRLLVIYPIFGCRPASSFDMSNQFYLCPNGIYDHTVMPPTMVDCTIPDELHHKSININVTLWGHRLKPLEYIGLKCYTQTHIACTNYGILLSEGL